MHQTSVFGRGATFSSLKSLPGLQYAADFITPEEEGALIAAIEAQPLREAQYRQYTARRRTVSYGAGYDYSMQRPTPAPPVPDFLHGVVGKAAAWAAVAPEDFVQALVAEYHPGTPLGWHRDVPRYELIFGLSLAGIGRLRFRPYPWRPELRKEIVEVAVEPRSAYILSGDARWQWQHHVPPAKVLRYSVTLRTQRR